MKELWVLTERTDFKRGGEYDYQNYDSKVKVFTSFKEAKEGMRKRIIELAHENGSMFVDGNMDCGGYEPEEATDKLTDLVNSVANDSNFVLTQEDVEEHYSDWIIRSLSADFEKEGWTDYMFGFGITSEEEPQLIVHGYDDGPCNDINPYIYINCFNMTNPNKKYSFHIDDAFDECRSFTSHLYLDLEKVIIE